MTYFIKRWYILHNRIAALLPRFKLELNLSLAMCAQNLNSILQLMLVRDLDYPIAGIGIDKDNLLLTRLIYKVIRTL